MYDYLRETPNSYARVEAPRRPTDDLDVEQLTALTLEAQEAADGLQRRADELRRALFRRRRLLIARGESVPDSSEISGLPNWGDQFRSESIAHDNYQIDLQAGRVAR